MLLQAKKRGVHSPEVGDLPPKTDKAFGELRGDAVASGEAFIIGIFLEDNRLLAIQLMRMGSKKSPSYRIVVREKRSKRDGAYLENIGFYKPLQNPAEINLDTDRVQYWLSKGAQPTDTVRQLIKKNSKAAKAAEPAAV
ncbi:MAG: 30S ribosomal protein S16 [Pyrinomonadaceae bacterium]